MPDSSPTSVAEFGVYKSFGSAENEIEVSLQSNNDSDMFSIGDDDSISNWISKNTGERTIPVDPALTSGTYSV